MNKAWKIMRNPEFLPTRQQIISIFGNWENWHKFCYDKNYPVFEFHNKEYILALADYLIFRAKILTSKTNRSLIILEIGAGNGKLSHFLRQQFNATSPGKIKIIATDSGHWNLKCYFSVEILNHINAMEKYNPDIVIISWMPYKKDFTKDIKKFLSLKEYILIGGTDGGCCGDEVETWSNCRHSKNKNSESSDYFGRINLDYLSKLQICRTDKPGDYYHSKTVSFRRINI